MSPPPLLTAADVARRLACSPRHARDVMHQLAHYGAGRMLRIDPAVLEAYIRSLEARPRRRSPSLSIVR